MNERINEYASENDHCNVVYRVDGGGDGTIVAAGWGNLVISTGRADGQIAWAKEAELESSA